VPVHDGRGVRQCGQSTPDLRLPCDCDPITIGAGSGGVAASRRAAAIGATFAIVEAGRVGGTCMPLGCVPKKLLMYAAQFGDTFAEARGCGWALPGPPRFGMHLWQQANAAHAERLEGACRRLLESSGSDPGRGPRPAGRLGARRRGHRHWRAHAARPPPARRHERLAGARQPPGIGYATTSDELLDLDHPPARVAVGGSGGIAVEFASMLARLGAKVSVCFRAEPPLRGFDTMLRSAAAAALQAAGAELHAGGLELGDERRREFDSVRNATGRLPNTTGLGLTRAAIAEGRALADTLFGAQPRTVDLTRVASAVFMLPPLASVGPPEDEAVAPLTH
jgi:glutathione reductase (NADPH)